MNKNPFAAQAGYNPQPPLPPGPPPPQPAQPDYSAYWAAAAAHQQAQAQAHAQAHVAQPAYPGAWPGAQQPATPAATPTAAASQAPARPTADQTALYANYGYGGQQGYQQWQPQQQPAQPQHQRAPHAHQQPAYQQPPPSQPQPPPPQQYAYQPQQPAAAAPYAPQYSAPVPQMQAPPMVLQPYPPQQQQPPQQPQQQNRSFYGNQGQRGGRGGGQVHYRNQGDHHGSPNHPHPNKRLRTDGSGGGYKQNYQQNYQQQAPPPQFQPPPPQPAPVQSQMIQMAPPQQMGGHEGGYGGGGRGARGGGQQMGRGGSQSGRGGRGRGGSTGNVRGGNMRGRGGSQYADSGRGRGGSQGGGSFKNPAARGNYSNNNQDYGNRRGGGSFSTRGGRDGGDRKYDGGGGHGGFYSQGSHPPYRGRGQGQGYSQNFGARRDRQDGGPHGNWHYNRHENKSMSSSFASASGGGHGGKKEETHRRTFTDFKIAGLEIRELSWTWSNSSAISQPAVAKTDSADAEKPTPSFVEGGVSAETKDPSAAPANGSVVVKNESADHSVPNGQNAPEAKSFTDMPAPTPPSRIRIYFHTPVTDADSRPLYGSFAEARKAKRKFAESEDGENHLYPPPSSHSDYGHFDQRASTAPSVAETTSEGDWLLAAIGQDDDEIDGEDMGLHVSEVGPHDEGEEHTYEEGNWEGEDNENGGYDESGHYEGNESQDMAGGMNGDGHYEAQEDDASVAAALAADDPAFAQTEGGDDTHASGADATLSANGLHGFNVAVSSEDPTSIIPSNGIDAASVPPPPAPEHAPVSSSDPSLHQPPASDVQSTTHDHANALERTQTQLSFEDGGESQIQTQEIEGASQVSLSADATTLITGLSQTGTISTYGELNELPMPTKTEALSGVRPPSASRFLVSYAAGAKRMVVNAEIVEKLTVFRAEARIEVSIIIDKDDTNGVKGMLLETLSDATSYTPLEAFSPALEADSTVPPLARLSTPTRITLTIHIDKAHPVSEPRWVKTGDVQDWLKSMFGGRFWVAGDAAEGWEKKIEVVDPDPAPTIWSLLENWTTHSPAGSLTERQRFLRTHMTETDNILEILLRLVRTERAYATSTQTSTVSNVSGPLLNAVSQGWAHAEQQNHISLSVLSIFRMASEYAKKALGDEKGKVEVEERLGEIIQCLPSHLFYKSMDGMFKEWRAEQKGGR